MSYQRLLGWQTRSLLLVLLLFFGACSSHNDPEGSDLEASEEDVANAEDGEDVNSENSNLADDAGNKEKSAEGAGENFAAAGGDQPAPTEGANGSTDAAQALSGPQNAAAQAAAPMNSAQAMMPVLESPPSTTGGLEMGTAGKEAAAGLPEMGSKLAYFVKKNDTLGRISKLIFGKSNHWRELAKLSGIKNANRIFPGDVIYYQLDQSSLAFATVYEGLQKEETQVAAGETLETVATRVYGKSDDWRLIWRQNDQILAPDQLAVGMKVVFVAKAELANLSHKIKEMRHTRVAAVKGFNGKTLASVKMAFGETHRAL